MRFPFLVKADRISTVDIVLAGFRAGEQETSYNVPGVVLELYKADGFFCEAVHEDHVHSRWSSNHCDGESVPSHAQIFRSFMWLLRRCRLMRKTENHPRWVCTQVIAVWDNNFITRKLTQTTVLVQRNFGTVFRMAYQFEAPPISEICGVRGIALSIFVDRGPKEWLLS